MGGTVDGTLGDHVVLAPPFIIEPAQIEELVGKLSKGLAVALKP
jgi:adenosylmethionine-8-amino-7-oxononanoate aminotransferase